MGYISWIIAFIYLAFTAASTTGGQNAIISNLLQVYATTNVVITIIIMLLFLLAIMSGDDEFITYTAIFLFFRIVLTVSALVMSANMGAEGLTHPVLFWLCFIVSLVFGGL